ncbi:MAG: hypothetical protein V3U75_11485 [Methylococcaceae bacterium]
MNKRPLTQAEIDEVSGGALATSFVVQTPKLIEMAKVVQPGGGAAAAVCQCVNCCSHHIEMDELVVNP